MFKNKYEFNTETLSYDKIELTVKEKIKKISLYTLSLLAFVALLSYGIFVYFYDTASYRSMKRENEKLREHYKVLNKRVDKMASALENMENRDDNIYRVILQKEPVPEAMRNAGFGGTDRYKKLRGFNNSDLIIKTTKRLDQLSKKLVVQSKSYDEVAKLAKKRSEEIKHIPAIRPVNMDKSYVTSYYGYRFHPIYKRREMHQGVDYAAPMGTKVYAPADGTVEKIRYSGGYGRLVVIDHGFGYKTRYAHLNKVLVRRGEKIERGDVIALIGNSGLSTGPHLHYEVHKDNVKVNPINYYFNDVSPREYQNIIRVATKEEDNNKEQQNS